MKKFKQDDPLRPRNVIKRNKRKARQQHKKIMAQKKEAEEKGASGDSKSVKQKIFHADVAKQVRQRIERMKEKIELPFRIKSIQRGQITRVLVINYDGKKRELLPDKPDCHKILCHGSLAKVITSGVCVFSKVTQHEQIDEIDGSRTWIDGSWTIAPCTPAMLRGTTVQHVKRRPLWFLHRYWYEISFDGRVQPAGMFFDYDIDPLRKKQVFYVTREYVKVRNTDHENNFLRFWRFKKNAKHSWPVVDDEKASLSKE